MATIAGALNDLPGDAGHGGVRDDRPGPRHAGAAALVAGPVRHRTSWASPARRPSWPRPRRRPGSRWPSPTTPDKNGNYAGRSRRLGAGLHARRAAAPVLPVRHDPVRLGARPAPDPGHRGLEPSIVTTRRGHDAVGPCDAVPARCWPSPGGATRSRRRGRWTPRVYVGVWLRGRAAGRQLRLAMRRRAPRRRAHPADRRARIWFSLGLAVFWLASDWPVATLGGAYLLSVHVVIYMLYTLRRRAAAAARHAAVDGRPHPRPHPRLRASMACWPRPGWRRCRSTWSS